MSSETDKRIADLEKNVAVLTSEMAAIKEFQKETKKDRKTFLMWFISIIGSGTLAFLGMLSKKLGLWE